MNKYSAIFSHGVLSRKTANTYTHAWTVTRGGRILDKGFAGSAQLAAKAAAAAMPRQITSRDKFTCDRSYRECAKREGVTLENFYISRELDRVADIASRTIEIVEVKAL